MNMKQGNTEAIAKCLEKIRLFKRYRVVLPLEDDRYVFRVPTNPQSYDRPNIVFSVIRQLRHPRLLRKWKSKIHVNEAPKTWPVVRDIGGSLIPLTTPLRKRRLEGRKWWLRKSPLANSIAATGMIHVCNMWTKLLRWWYRGKPLIEVVLPKATCEWKRGDVECYGERAVVAVFDDKVLSVVDHWNQDGHTWRDSRNHGNLVAESQTPLWWAYKEELSTVVWHHIVYEKLEDSKVFIATTNCYDYRLLVRFQSGWLDILTGELLNTTDCFVRGLPDNVSTSILANVKRGVTT